MNPFRTLQKAIQGGRSLIDALGLAAQVNEVEDWHEVGAVGEPAFENSWVNYGAGYESLVFCKDPFGWVHIEGFIKSGTMTAVAFTLPSGYLPRGHKYFPSASNGAYGDLYISSTGAVTPYTGSNTWFSINRSFRAA